MDGWRLFIQYMKEHYHHEFNELSNEYKDNVIDEILLNNAKYFDGEHVLAENLCHKCGLCCREIGCPYLKGNLCSRHNNQEAEVCRTYPWDDEVGFILTLNCGYQIDYVIKFFDIFFKKAIEMMEVKK